nr:hypothetical protein [Bacillus pumilus]
MVKKKGFMHQSFNAGSQENQSWRKKANDRILEHRQRELMISVTNDEKSQ